MKKKIIAISLTVVVYFIAAKLGLMFAVTQENVTLIWPPTGIAVGSLIIWGYRLWPGVALGAFLTNISTDIAVSTSLAIMTGNTLEALVGAIMVRRLAISEEFWGIRDVLAIYFIVALLPTTISATFGALSLYHLEGVSTFLASKVWVDWWLGDALGLVMFMPLLVTWYTALQQRNWRWNHSSFTLALITLLFGIPCYISEPLLSIDGEIFLLLPLPFLIFTIIRRGALAATTLSFLLSAILIISSISGGGPFHEHNAHELLVHIYGYIFSLNLIALLTAAAIKERQEVERRLFEKSSELNKILKNIPDIIYRFSDRHGGVYYAGQVETILGYTIDSLSKTPWRWQESIHPDDMETIKKSIHNARLTGQPFAITYRIRNARGDWLWFHDRSISIWEKAGELIIEGIATDITQRKRDDAKITALSELNSKAEVIGGLGSWEWQVDDNRQFWSDNLYRLLGWSVGEVQPSQDNFFSRIDPQDSVHIHAQLRRTLATLGHLCEVEFRVILPDGTVRILHSRSELVDEEHGKKRRLIGLAQDVTNLRLIEQQALQASQMAMLGKLSANIAHEINNPNNSISFSASLLRSAWRDALTVLDHWEQEHGHFTLDGAPYPQMRLRITRLIDLISDNATRIKNIVSSIKNLSRKPAQEIRLMTVNPLLKQTVEMLEASIQARTDRFTLTLADPDLTLCGNPNEIEQVFTNLLVNSLESLKDKAREVTITVHSCQKNNQEMVAVTITDQGTGMDPETVAQIFKPFFTTKQDAAGTGLGLAICQTIIEAHGGELIVDSRPSVGTTMTVFLPACCEPGADANPPPSKETI